jgi:hypothetical protein
MNCTEYVLSLQNQLDGIAGEFPEAEHHLRACASCRELHRGAQRLLAGIHADTVPVSSSDLSRTIYRQVLADMRRRRWQNRLIVSAAAAAVLIALLSGWSHFRSGPAMPPVAIDQNRPPSLRQSVEQASYAVAAMTKRATDETLDQSRFFMQVALPTRHTLVAEEPIVLREPPLEPLRAVQHGVSDGFEPVTTSARRAVNLFWHEKPSSPKENM